jgi:hypothetical protein
MIEAFVASAPVFQTAADPNTSRATPQCNQLSSP